MVNKLKKKHRLSWPSEADRHAATYEALKGEHRLDELLADDAVNLLIYAWSEITFYKTDYPSGKQRKADKKEAIDRVMEYLRGLHERILWLEEEHYDAEARRKHLRATAKATRDQKKVERKTGKTETDDLFDALFGDKRPKPEKVEITDVTFDDEGP